MKEKIAVFILALFMFVSFMAPLSVVFADESPGPPSLSEQLDTVLAELQKAHPIPTNAYESSIKAKLNLKDGDQAYRKSCLTLLNNYCVMINFYNLAVKSVPGSVKKNYETKLNTAKEGLSFLLAYCAPKNQHNKPYDKLISEQVINKEAYKDSLSDTGKLYYVPLSELLKSVRLTNKLMVGTNGHVDTSFNSVSTLYDSFGYVKPSAATGSKTDSEGKDVDGDSSSAVPGKLNRINMSGDFSDGSTLELHEHWLWKQFCNGSVGVCGHNSEIHKKKTQPAHSGCWVDIPVSNATVKEEGCFLLSICMAMYDAGAVSPDFTPDDWICESPKLTTFQDSFLDSSALVNGKFKRIMNEAAMLAKYPDFGTYVCNNPSLNQDAKVNIVESVLANENYYIVCWTKNNLHAMYCMGTAVNPHTGNRDLVLCDPGCNSTNMYANGGNNLAAERAGITDFTVFEASNCTPFVNGFSSAEVLESITLGGSSLFAEDDELVIPSMKLYLNNLSDEDFVRISAIGAELHTYDDVKSYSLVSSIFSWIGWALLVYVMLLLFGYLMSLWGIGIHLNLLGVVTFHAFEEAVLMKDENSTVKSMSFIRFIFIFLFGLGFASLFIVNTRILSVFLALWDLFLGH